MKRKNEKNKSVIPANLQISLVVLLGIVFIFLLNARLKGGATSEGALSTGVEERASNEEKGTADCGQRLGSLIDKIRINEPVDDSDRRRQVPELVSDPFVEPDSPTGGTASDRLGQLSRELDSQRREWADNGDRRDGRSRDEFVESLTLQATLVDGNARFALISGKLFTERDGIGQFKIVKIGERVAFLSDDTGDVLLKMKGDDEL